MRWARGPAAGRRSGPARLPGLALAGPVLPCALAAGLVLAVLLATGTDGAAIAAYAAYLLVGLLLPGTLVHRLLRGGAGPLGVDLALGAATGLALELLAWAAATALHAPLVLRLWPLAVVVPTLLTASGRRLWRPGPSGCTGRREATGTAWAVAGTYALTTLTVALPAMRAAALPPRPTDWYQDLYWHLSIAADLTRRVPPQVPQVSGRPLYYHWFSDAHLAASHVVTGVPLPTILVRLWLLPALAVLLGLLVAVARRLTGRLWPGAVAAALTAAPAMLVPWNGFRPVLTAGFLPSSPSQVYGVVFVLLAADVLVDVVRGVRIGRGWVLLVLAVAAASGGKSSALPVLLGGLVTALVVARLARRRVRGVMAATALVTGVLVGSAPVVAGGAAGSAVRVFGILAFVQPWRAATGSTALAGTGGWVVPGLDSPAAASVAGLVVLALLLQYVWILAGVSLLRRPRRADPAAALLAGGMLAGLLATLVLDHPSASQLYFALTALPLGALFAAWGVYATGPVPWRAAAGGAAAAVGAVAAATVVAPRVRRSDVALPLALPVLVLAAAGLGGLLGWRLLRRHRPGLRGRGAGVLAVALVAGCLVTGPVRGIAALRTELSHPAVPSPRALRPAEVTAAQWLDRHAGPDDVVATNMHCLRVRTRPACDARAFWVSGLAARRVLVEGWGYTDQAQQAHGRNGLSYRNQPFDDPALLALNEAAFRDPTPAVLTRLYRDYGVRWLFADRRAGPVSPLLPQLADLRLDRPPVQVLRLRG